MLKGLSYLILLAEVLFMLRSRKLPVTITVTAIYIVLFAIIVLNRKYIIPKPLGYIATISMGAHYIFMLTLSTYIVFLVILRITGLHVPNGTSMVVIIITACITLYGVCNGIATRVSYYNVYTTKTNCIIRLVQISDLHLSNIYDAKEISKLVDKINNLKPDVICITGDMFTNKLSTQIDMDSACKEFSRLNPKYGIYVSYGNHDRDLIPELQQLCDKSGFKLLIDGTATFDGINVIGRPCYPDGVPIDNLLSNDMYNIVLDHTPERVDEAIDSNVDMLLCGHTHGGQLLPFTLGQDILYGVSSGAWQEDDNTFVLVNQGAGLIYPYCRVKGISEIVCIDINNIAWELELGEGRLRCYK